MSTIREEAVELLKRVKTRVEATDWTKGSYESYDYDADKPTYCLAGLVNVEAGAAPALAAGWDLDSETDRSQYLDMLGQREGHLRRFAFDLLRPVIRAEYGRHTVEHFNDSPSTRREDILRVLDKAIETGGVPEGT